jgi:hypothetical protein
MLAALGTGCLAAVVFPLTVCGAESANDESGQITLRKSVGERQYKGKSVAGEERRVAPGDSLWRILIQEKGLSGKRFSEYIVVIRGLNPGLSSSGALRIGETIFIPLRPDEVLQIQSAPSNTRAAISQPAKATTQEYRIKQGDHLYQVLRERLGIMDERQLAIYYVLVKDLNPQKKNWDLLVEGETIRLPVFTDVAEARSLANRAIAESKSGAARESSAPAETKTPSADIVPPPLTQGANPKMTTQGTARENLALVARVMESLGNEVQINGEAVLALKEGTVRIENSSFPVIYNRNLNQKIIVDADDKMPLSIRSKLSGEPHSASVFALSRALSVHDAVNQLLSRLGYQPLSDEQPIVLQQGGLTLEAKGEWMVLAPEESRKRQEIFVINISDGSEEVPDYLRAQFASSGVHLKEIMWTPSTTGATSSARRETKELLAESKVWPRDKREIIDALLFAYGIPFGVSEVLSVELHPGIKLETACDRLFELRDQRTALFFRPIAPELRRAFEARLKVKVVELDMALSSRDLIGKLLGEIGELAAYKEHRFSAATGSKQDKLTVSAWGYLLNKPAMFITDRQIPKQYERFFFEKGLDIVYFQ